MRFCLKFYLHFPKPKYLDPSAYLPYPYPLSVTVSVNHSVKLSDILWQKQSEEWDVAMDWKSGLQDLSVQETSTFFCYRLILWMLYLHQYDVLEKRVFRNNQFTSWTQSTLGQAGFSFVGSKVGFLILLSKYVKIITNAFYLANLYKRTYLAI